MKSPYASELKPNELITAVFLVQNKEIRQKKSGEPYLSLLLSDRTGDVEAKMWDNVADLLESFQRDDFLRVRGLVSLYQNKLQLTLHKLERLVSTDVDCTDFFPSSKRSAEEMFAELQGIVREIGDPDLRGLVEGILGNEEIALRFRLAPAAKTIHHAYLGGLLEHVLSLCHLCRVTAAHYPVVDRDLLLTGAILHDIGKIHELTYDRSFGYSSDGQMLGHIVIALRIVGDQIARQPAFPPRLRTLVEHLIVSHHGELEFGSPKVPVFAEAMLLHHLDNLDSKMEAIRCSVERDRNIDGCWTSYVAPLGRSLLKKDKYLEAAEAPVPSPAPVLKAMPATAPKSAPPPKNGSAFAEKLQLALGEDL